MVKEGWEEKKLGDLINTRKGYAFKSKWYSDKGRYLVKVSDFTENSVKIEGLTHIPEEIAKDYLDFELNGNEIVIQTVGSWPRNPESVVGKVIKIPKELYHSLLNQNAVIIKPNYNKLDHEFTYFLLKSQLFKGYIINTAQGAANQASITLESIKNFKFLCPESIKVQQKIGTILSNYNNLIENNEKRIKILEQMAKLIYEEWFINFKFPGHESIKMIDSKTDFAKIPEGWKVGKIGDKINIPKGKNITKSTVSIGKIPVVAAGLSPACHHNQSNAESPVFTISASGANAGFIKLYYENIWASDCSYVNNKVTPYVFYYYSLIKNKQTEITSLQRGSAQPHVYPKDIMNLLIVYPPEELIIKFEKISKSIFLEIGNLSHKNQNLRKTRDFLLPKLISGEVDVSGLDIKLSKVET